MMHTYEINISISSPSLRKVRTWSSSIQTMGLEVKSVPRGKKKSSKYIYWSEIEASYKSGHSILLYQHFPRKPRESFIRSLIQQFKALEGIRSVISYCTFHVAFLLIPQPHHEDMFIENTVQISQTWGDVIRVKKHPVTRIHAPI